jgi:hypothetical protein
MKKAAAASKRASHDTIPKLGFNWGNWALTVSGWDASSDS